MKNNEYFWDSCIFMGCCLFVDFENNKNLLDSHSENCNKFEKNTLKNKHLISKHSVDLEIKKLFEFRKKAIKILIMKINGRFQIQDLLSFQIPDKHWDWIDQTKEKLKKYPAKKVIDMLTDFQATFEIRKEALLKKLTTHPTFTPSVRDELKPILNNNSDDAKIFATCIHYFNNTAENLIFITSDKNDFETVKNAKLTFKTPEIKYIWDC